MSTLGLYLPGTSVLHRARAGHKLIVLLVVGAASFTLDRPWQVGAALALVAVLYTVAGIGPRLALAQLRPLVWVAGVAAVFHLVVSGWERAVVVLGVLTVLVLLAGLVTLTTRTTAMVDALVAACRPLHRVGVDAERLGLMLALGVRCVPLVVGLAQEVREAQLAGARGEPPRVRGAADRAVAAPRGRPRRGSGGARRRGLSPAAGAGIAAKGGLRRMIMGYPSLPALATVRQGQAQGGPWPFGMRGISVRKHYLGLAVAVAAATVASGTATANAAPPAGMHCDGHSSPGVTKVELSGEVTHLDLPAGTIICAKSSTENTGVVVVGDGGFTNTIRNQRGNIRGISYFVIYGHQEPPCDPYDSTSDCYEPPSSG